MILIIAYYLKEEPNKILFESLANIELDDGFSRFLTIDHYMNNRNLFRTDLYSLMIVILNQYCNNQYTNDIEENQEEYERVFKDKFVYNFVII